MPNFGKRSKKELATCHEKLQKVLNEAIKDYDFSVICGHRGRADQEKAFKGGFSNVQWPKSKHNKRPSLAADCAPFPIDWNDTGRFHEMGLVVKAAAKRLKIPITWGGDWKRFKDLPHFEVTA